MEVYLESPIVVLKASPVRLFGSGEHDSPKEQDFLFWDGEAWRKWDATDFEIIIHVGTVAEIQLQPLKLSDESKKSIQNLCDSGASGTSVHRNFWWKRNLKWEPDMERRITWKLDPDVGKVYTTFETGKWVGTDGDLKFVAKATTNDMSGSCLSGLYLAMNEESKEPGAPIPLEPAYGQGLPSQLDYTACHKTRFDGIPKMTSFKGAHLCEAVFCGQSTLIESDLASSNCWGLRFDFPHLPDDIVGIGGKFRTASLKGAAFIETADFHFHESTTTKQRPPRRKRSEPVYGTGGCCGRKSKQGHCGVFGCFDVYYGLRNTIFFLCFALWKARDMLLKHRDEIRSLVEELERLRKYEVTQDNWQELIDSWLALETVPLETQKAAEMREYLFEKEYEEFGAKKSASRELLLRGKILYMIDGEPPYGLLLVIKTLLGEKLLRNEDYMARKQDLTDELANIEVILGLKDQVMTILQNFLLGVFVFGANIGANIVAERWGYDLLALLGLEVDERIVV